MSSILDGVKTFRSAVPKPALDELGRVFPADHFVKLFRNGFRFYRTAFWLPREREPENAFETVVDGLARWAEPRSDVVGAEWWFSVGRTNATPEWLLPCHFDRNDLDEKDFTKLRFPFRSSVLFLNAVPYGELVITDQVLTSRGVQPPRPTDMRFIKPARNMYAVFPGELLHGVIGRMWRPQKPEQLRVTMAINWWTSMPKAQYLRDSRECMAAFGLSGGAAGSAPHREGEKETLVVRALSA